MAFPECLKVTGIADLAELVQNILFVFFVVMEVGL